MKPTVPDRKLLEAALAAMKEGTVAVPHLLLKTYRDLQLSELDAMLLIHLIAFIDKEKKEFPTIEEIQSRMAAAPEALFAALQKLLKLELLSIDEGTDDMTGIRYERYNLDPLYVKLAERLALELKPAAGRDAGPGGFAEGKDIFTIFEKEFARPLTPMEMEMISGWLDRDQYKEELILAALKEAVFSGKLHFRYIDRILLEWSRNRVRTVEQAKEFTQRFRGAR
jgi:DNA replication protein